LKIQIFSVSGFLIAREGTVLILFLIKIGETLQQGILNT